MLRFFAYLSIVCMLLVAACSKSNSGNETIFYGTWVNSNAPKDTLQFTRRDGKNILRTNQSFNTSLPNNQETEYSFINGKLAVYVFGPNEAFNLVTSFAWIQEEKQFDILGFQLYPFMSSSTTHFTYTKIN